MKLYVSVSAIMALSACQVERKPEPVTPDNAMERSVSEAYANASIDAAAAASEAAREPAPSPRSLPSREPEPAPVADLCWQDYCPCNAPANDLDRSICRSARAGLYISGERWANAASTHDLSLEADRIRAR